MEKFVCIHGHFYQPPRENPWLEAVELQDSAAPYHDWNERITAECYAPNAHARFMDAQGRIERIVCNYARISFNFGPTLLSWLAEKAPDIYQAIIDADQESRARFSGHGSALAQGYNHVILPLANERDKRTQVIWGIHDFESRFGRPPEGMWLPETAADGPTLEVLAGRGVKFTLLSPFQASRVRPLDGGDWEDVNGGRIDPSRAYLVKLPSGKSISVFFYDAPIARELAFEQLLKNGGQFANRLRAAFNDGRDWDQLVHVATDGESYGHHFRYGDMALAYALHSIETAGGAKLTVYGEFLERHPPTHEVEIHQPSAWSCPHGVDRWKRHCGCNSGGHAGWNQQWREPLRQALDWLRDQLAPRYEDTAKQYLKEPWTARDDYISVILDRSPENRARYFAQHATRDLNEADQITALRLLEMQRHTQLMYTSCGWFFDEISGPESVQVIQYAARAIQLANGLLDENFQPCFLEILGRAKSNLRENRDGREIYSKFVTPAIMNREMAGAHYAISSLFESYPEEATIFSFSVKQENREALSAGNAKLAVGCIKVTFRTTLNSDVLTYAVIHLGDHNMTCGVKYDCDPAGYATLAREAREAFEHADFAEVIRLMDRHFGGTHYSLKNLFRDEQRRVLDQILAATRNEIHNTYRLITDRHAPLLRFLADLHAPPFRSLRMAAELVINSDLRRQFEGGTVDIGRVRELLAEAGAIKAEVDNNVLGYAVKRYLDGISNRFLTGPDDRELLQHLAEVAELIHNLPFEVNLWLPQNNYFAMLTSILPDKRRRAEEGDKAARAWVGMFVGLGGELGFNVEPAANGTAP